VKRLRVAVIFGGKSVEHEVSIVSARSFVAAMDKSKYEPVLIGIDTDGHWLLVGDDFEGIGKRLLPTSGAKLRLLDEGVADQGKESNPARYDGPGKVPPVDVVVPMLHGSFGEDGCVQGFLELLNLPYVGSGVLGSALCLDKITTKRLLRAEGLPVPNFLPITKAQLEESPQAVLANVGKKIGFPCFVKPSNSGSSVGITKVHEASELEAALESASAYDRRIIVEEAIDGRELEVSVLGNDAPIASVVGEVVPCNEFYDYNAKYVDDRSELIIPAKIPKEVSSTVQELAVRAFRLLDCSGMARADFFLEKMTQRVFINEINTVPGFTSISMYPKLWEASGIGYPQLVDRLIELALQRHNEKKSRKYRYEG